MIMPAQVKTNTIYQIKVTLKGSKPPIWRRIQVDSGTTLFKLHQVLQDAMDWSGGHLHQFEIHGRHYSHPDYELDKHGDDILDERKFKLSQVSLEEKMKFSYEYDFGDGWEHELLIEKIIQNQEKLSHPVCLAGKRACPPEDCGGPWGYAELLEILSDPKHPEYEERKEWVGSYFNPEEFDIEETNRELKQVN